MSNLENINQQMEFSDLKPDVPEPEFEKIDCQYCEDVGPCMYCKRGQIESAEIKRLKKVA